MTTHRGRNAAALALAAAAGVAGTLVVQHVQGPETTGPESGPAPSAAQEVARRDAEIERLRADLAEARKARPARAAPPPASAPAPAPPPDPGPRNEPAKAAAAAEPATDWIRMKERTDAWVADLRQVKDPSKREAAWAEVRQALSGTDRVALLAALQTVASTRDVKVDRNGLRELVLPSTDAPEPQLRLAAWSALVQVGVEPADLDKLRRQVAESPKENQTRSQMLLRLNWAAKSDLRDEASSDLIVRLFEDSSDRKNTVYALQGARLSDAAVSRVLEYARSSNEAAQHAQHFVLRTLADKNRDVLSFLLDRAEAGDTSGIEQLRSSVRAEDVAYVGERLRALSESRSHPYVRSQLISTIGMLQDEGSREWLVKLRDDEQEDASVRSAAKEALQRLDRPRR